MPRALTGRRVLLVEDEALIALAVEDDLLNAGAAEVAIAASADDAPPDPRCRGAR